MAEKSLREKLIALGAERLAEELIKLTRTNPETKTHIERLVATPADRLRRVRSALARLKLIFDSKILEPFHFQ